MNTTLNIISNKTEAFFIKEYGEKHGKRMFWQCCTGQTTAIALLAIGTAMRNPQVPTWVVDHYNTPASNQNLKETINTILDKTGLKGFTLDKGHITYNPFIKVESK